MTSKYEPVEILLTSTNTHSNPYIDVSLSAKFTNIETETIIQITGFWDGNNNYKIRISPTKIGTWSYITTSNDSQLNNKSGSFNITESVNKGFIKVNPNNPYTFIYDDGSQFFLMGDTLWMYPENYSLFTQYIDNISSNKYNCYNNVVVYKNKINEGGVPFKLLDSTDNPVKNYDILFPTYFIELDKQIKYANSKEVIPQLFLVWSQEFIKMTRIQFERFAKYMVARYSAYNIIWIISAEYTETSIPSEYSYQANVIYQNDPYKHLISIHPSGNLSSSRDYSTSTQFSYIMQQMGYNIPLETNQYILNDRKFNKPVVNGEAHYLYDGEIDVNTFRKQNWLISMAGGYFITGYQQIFWYGYDEAFPFNLNNANNNIGMQQMKYLFDFFNQLDFSKLTPNNSISTNGYTLISQNSCIIYVLNGGSITVNLSSLIGTLNVKWYNPTTGIYQGQTTTQGGINKTFTAPNSNDWILYISSSCPQLQCSMLVN